MLKQQGTAPSPAIQRVRTPCRCSTWSCSPIGPSCCRQSSRPTSRRRPCVDQHLQRHQRNSSFVYVGKSECGPSEDHPLCPSRRATNPVHKSTTGINNQIGIKTAGGINAAWDLESSRCCSVSAASLRSAAEADLSYGSEAPRVPPYGSEALQVPAYATPPLTVLLHDDARDHTPHPHTPLLPAPHRSSA